MAIPLPQFLVEFGTDDEIQEQGEAASVLEPVDPPPYSSAGDLASARIEEAYARGEEAARTAARSEYEQSLTEYRENAEQHLRSERLKWTVEQADRLSEQLSMSMKALEAEIAASVANVLKPFLTSELRNRMVEGLSESIRVLLSHDRNTVLHVRGPDDLLTELRGRLTAVPDSIKFESSSGTDVQVCADRTVIESQIQTWIDLFKEE